MAGSRYPATSRARSATVRSTVRTSRSRSWGSVASASAASSRSAGHFESIGRRRPSGSTSPNSTTRPFTRKSRTSIDGGRCTSDSRSTFSPTRPVRCEPDSTDDTRCRTAQASSSRWRRSSSRVPIRSSEFRNEATSLRMSSVPRSRQAAESATRRSSAPASPNRASTARRTAPTAAHTPTPAAPAASTIAASTITIAETPP